MADERKEMAALLNDVGFEESAEEGEVIDFEQRLRDGLKIRYVSNVRVTEENKHDWMALPLLEEAENEATCSGNRLLMMHVPSLREFLHKFDAIPLYLASRGEIKQEIKQEEPDVDIEPSAIATASSTFFTASEFEDVASSEDPHLESGDVDDDAENLMTGDVDDDVENLESGDVDDDAENLMTGDVDDDVENLESGDVDDDVEHLMTGDVDDDAEHLMTGDVDDDAEHLMTGDVDDDAEHLMTGDVDDDAENLMTGDVDDDAEHLMTGDVDDDAEHLMTGDVDDDVEHLKPTLRSFLPFSVASFLAPDDVTVSEEEPSDSQNDPSPIAEFLKNFANDECRTAVASPERVETPPTALSAPVCTFKIEPDRGDDGWPMTMEGAPPPSASAADSVEALMALLAAAADAEDAPDASASAPLADDVVAELPPVRPVAPVAVKKQMTVQSPCPRCYVMIETLDEARAHIEEASCATVGAHACDVCAKRLASKWTLKKHVERHADKPRCVFCSNRFASLEELRDHNLLSGHMFRAEEAVTGAPDIAVLRKQRKREHKEASKSRESENNLASVLAAVDGAATSAAATTMAAAHDQPPAKKVKIEPIYPVDEAAAAVAFLMAEEAGEEEEEEE